MLRLSIRVVGIGIAVLAIGMLWYPNRRVCEDYQYGGVSCTKWRWGKPVEEYLDRNMDGAPDYVIRYLCDSPRTDPRWNHTEFEDWWIDQDKDGVFEIHIDHRGGPNEWGDPIDRLQLDTTGDGRYDQELLGEEAWDYFHAHGRPDA